MITFSPPSGPSVTWQFDDDGVFQTFGVEIRGEPADMDTVVFVCEHVTPDYTGVLYSCPTASGSVKVCPKCVQARKEIVEGTKMNVIDSLLWQRMLPRVSVRPL